MWDSLGAVCVGGFGCVLWLGYYCVSQGVMVEGLLCLFSVLVFCEISLGCALGGEMWGLVGEVGVIGTLKNCLSVRLPLCSLRISEALCGVGVNWMVDYEMKYIPYKGVC